MKWKLISFSLLLLIASRSYAGTADIQFRGTVIERAACTINNGNDIMVNFGDIDVNYHDWLSGAYDRIIPYSFDCGADTPATVRLTLIGVPMVGEVPAYADAAVIQTSVDRLGIFVRMNNNPFILNQPVTISTASIPEIKVSPLAETGIDLNPVASESGGLFTASAKLLIDYQ
ncbi:TPA: hypothetical protein RVR73_003058 [Aeromonas hydrophila]|nr:hypothetical protein [Aeromonas hydrophila]